MCVHAWCSKEMFGNRSLETCRLNIKHHLFGNFIIFNFFVTLFIFAALCMILPASSYLPLAMSHLGDSGVTMYKRSTKNIGIEEYI
jgi:hypothetical protein